MRILATTSGTIVRAGQLLLRARYCKIWRMRLQKAPAPALCEVQAVLRHQSLCGDARLPRQAPDDALPLVQRGEQRLILLLGAKHMFAHRSELTLDEICALRSMSQC